MEISKNNIKTSITLVDELMVDITGSLIPGFLFLIILFFSVFMPLFTLSSFTLNNLTGKEIPGGFFWVLLVIILILAYVVGHIFYRADIQKPDKVDIKREIDKSINDIIKDYDGNDEEKFRTIIKMKLRNTIITINDTCMNVPLFKPWYQNGVCLPPQQSQDAYKNIYWCFCKACNLAVDYISNKQPIPQSVLLGILFPEEVYRFERNKHPKLSFYAKNVSDGIAFEELHEDIKKIWNEYEERLSKTKKIGKRPIVDEEILWLTVCWCILEVQIEIGCISINDCSFPYTYYYKYLLKRNITKLIDEVKWNSQDSRSKNIINEYKTQMHLFVPEKYAIINKNESHVRMSSSTWHMAKVSIWIAGFMVVISILLIIYARLEICVDSGFQVNCFNVLLSISLPSSVIGFSVFLRFRIAKFIHYQRNREIFHAICAYDQCEKIIRHRKHLQSTSIGN